MSAITGIFYRDGRSVDPEIMKKMNDRLSHRGPDGSQVWVDGSIGLGHQMLWTTPESLHEELPFEENGLVITADARIDNREELSAELGIEDKEEVSDSYFILKAYEKWGEDCPDKLLGDFAFAIWDKAEETLFCARDHMGVKPFYYYLDEDMFVFGSEIKAVLSISNVPYELNELQLAFFLASIYNERTFTFYKEIFRLPAATHMVLNLNKSKIVKYWTLNQNLKTNLNSDEEYASKFLEIFTEAVKCRLRSIKPLGFELSGGLDSSSVVCVAKNILTDQNSNYSLNTFSKSYGEINECDESYYINKIIDLGGINPHYIQADQISPLNEIENILMSLEEPFFANNRHSSWILYKNMEKNNIRVLLTGNDGDTTVSHGNNYLKELALNLKWKKLIKEINSISKQFNINISKILLNKLFLTLLPGNILKYWSINIKKTPKFLFNNKKFVEKIDFKKFCKKYRTYNFTAKNAKEYHYQILTHGMHQFLLEVHDRTTTPFFIEARHPFYDKRLIEFCYSVPTEQKIRHGWGRLLLRHAMEDILPKEIQWRYNKINFNPVLTRNLLKFEENSLDELIFKNNEILKDYIDLDEFINSYKEYKSNRTEYHPKQIKKLIILAIWLRKTRIQNRNF